eukprot:TRINITY_DN11169_c0_g2_i2.p3 TRINITY_DN11169_c0_g2~~TRINITY_DN11169_c0_g2_i2.p3  ORF type:complete len:102 (-),score=6.52 TRINITY_DN11169_c0_g2_i2:888-1193(-)
MILFAKSTCATTIIDGLSNRAHSLIRGNLQHPGTMILDGSISMYVEARQRCRTRQPVGLLSYNLSPKRNDARRQFCFYGMKVGEDASELCVRNLIDAMMEL